MRRRCYGSLLAFALACAAPLRAEEIVDLFPGQPWESLQLQAASTQGQALPNPALATPLPVPMPEAAEPFTALGEWRQQGQRVLVLQGQSDSYLLCAASCPGAAAGREAGALPVQGRSGTAWCCSTPKGGNTR